MVGYESFVAVFGGCC